jgi:hypothetical protein
VLLSDAVQRIMFGKLEFADIDGCCSDSCHQILKMKISIQSANAAIDEYLLALQSPRNLPTQIRNRIWILSLMIRHGIVYDIQNLHLNEIFAIWYAILVLAKRVREVSRIECQVLRSAPGSSTENTIQRLRTGDLRSTVVAPVLEKLLMENQQHGQG